MNSKLSAQKESVSEWIGSEENNGGKGSQDNGNGENLGPKFLIRQDSIHDVAEKTLVRQVSLHDADKKSLEVSSDRSLSWDNYVDSYTRENTDEILEGLREIREELGKETEEDDDRLSRNDDSNRIFPEECTEHQSFTSACQKAHESLSVASHRHYKKPNFSQTSSKNSQLSGEVSDFSSFESNWNSKYSSSLETYQSHRRRRDTFDSSSGITSISEDTYSSKKGLSQTSSSRRSGLLPLFDSSEDLYEYDDDLANNRPSGVPSVDEDLMAKVLCSERVSQMSKTYNDIEAVTRLLEEKEKDLELTARIGKELLTHNNKLENNVATLEAELKAANDKIEQISHELTKKTELIQVLTNDTDESGSEANTPTALKCINIEFMQRRIKTLEDENKALQKEFAQMTRDAEKEEEKEQKLVEIISLKLANANVELEGMSDDLERQKEENRHEHEQIVSLKAKLKDTEEKYHKVLMENEELLSVLNITKENQNKLAAELVEFKDRYEEVVNFLQDAQEQLKKHRKKTMPSVRGGFFSSLTSSGLQLHDNLATELESSLHSELSLDSGISTDRLSSYKKVFETVKYAQPKNLGSSQSNPATSVYNKIAPLESSVVTSSTSAPRMSASSYPSKTVDSDRRNLGGSTVYNSYSVQSLDSMGVSDSESVTSEDITYPNGPNAGGLGMYSSAEIADALRRLTPAEVSARRAALGNDPLVCRGYSEYDATIVPFGCRTPDSIMSTGSSAYMGHNYWRIPNKLQIVKPMEGSQTLYQWSMLAKPSLGGLLEERPGVQTKGGKTLEDLGFEIYTLSDVEEDEEFVNPGKSFQNSSSIYTFTNSTVMHPDDNTNVTPSIIGSKMSMVASSSRQSTAPPTPRVLSRRNSCSTFSMTYGLAKLLNERGIEAATASAFNTPSCEKSFSPTATPANSPDGSPNASRSPSPTPLNSLRLPGFLTSGAEILRRTFISNSPPRSPKRSRRNKMALTSMDRKALSGIRLMEKIESMGLETIIANPSGIIQPALQRALYPHRSLTSPMAQLTNLKGALASPSVDKNMSDLAKEVSPRRGERRTSGRSTPTHRRRSDLGTVSGTVTPSSDQQSSGPLGTISTILFGRKGGLL